MWRKPKKAIARLFPGLELNGAINHDGNMFLVNSQWSQAGASLSWNLFNILSTPARLRLAEAQEKVGQARRLTLHMAVLSQVHVAYHQYLTNNIQFQRADRLDRIEQKILTHTTNQQSQNPPSVFPVMGFYGTNVPFFKKSQHRSVLHPSSSSSSKKLYKKSQFPANSERVDILASY